jgi:hypothetical protein
VNFFRKFRGNRVGVFKDFRDLFFKVIIFISGYFTNKYYYGMLINNHFNKQQCTVFPPPANQCGTLQGFISATKYAKHSYASQEFS